MGTGDGHSTNSPFSFDRFPQLLAAAKAGNQSAMTELMDGCRNYLLLIANQEVDRDLQQKLGPSDVVQNSMIAIYEHVGEFQGDHGDQFFAWARQILFNDLNQARRHYKKTSKRNMNRELPVAGDSRLGQLPLQLNSPAHTPQTAAARAEERVLVEQAMNRIPLDYQEVIRLRHAEQLSFDEIGDRLDRTADAAQKLWTRAIEKLKSELKKLGAV